MTDISFLIGNLNSEHGGAQQLLRHISLRLPQSKFDVTIYYMFGEGTMKAELVEAGINVEFLDANSNFDLQAFSSFLERLRDDSPDILQTNSPISGVWGRMAAKMSSVPNVVSVEHSMHWAYPWKTQLANGITLPLADTVVCVSEAVADSIHPYQQRLLSKTEIQTIRNGVPITEIKEQFSDSSPTLEENTDIPQDATIVGTVGRLAEAKGIEYLIKSFPAVVENIPTAHLLIIGDGPRRNKLEKLTSELRINDRVHFMGYVTDVYPLLPKLDIAVFPSLWEGLPLAPAEVMVAKVPIVATKIDPFQELVDDAGILVPPEDEQALAHAIEQLLKNKPKRIDQGQAAYDRVQSEFSIEQTASQYIDLYRTLVGEQ